jgi:hypothetical protein
VCGSAPGATEARPSRSVTGMTADQYDPDLENRLLSNGRLTPYAADGLTHSLTIRDDLATSVCGKGARLSRNWRLVNCDDCRTS